MSSLRIFAFLLVIFAANVNKLEAYSIEGTLTPPPDAPSDWMTHTRVHIEGGQLIGFIRPDGSFSVHGVPSGSHLVEFVNPVYLFQPVRLDISLRGSFRARRVTPLQPNAVKTLHYPLRVSSIGKASYFQTREQLRTMDLLLNPTVLFMVVPLLLVMVLPKMLDTSDPDLQKEMQQMNFLNAKQSMPDMSELLSSMLGGGGSGGSKSSKKALGGAGPSSAGSSSAGGPGSLASSGGSLGGPPGAVKKLAKKRN